MKHFVKVPIVMQMETLECGAASLCMVLAYYKKWVPLEQVRQDCGVSRDGSSAKNILKAARGYGMEAKGFRYEPEQLRDNVQFPCIIHWDFNHFLVLCGFKKGKAVLNDPRRGTHEVTMEEFDRSFTGIVLQFVPTEDFKAGGAPKSIRSFVKKRLHGAKIPLIFALVISVITALFGIISPAFSRIFFDRLLSGENTNWLIPFLLGFGLFSALQLIITFIQKTYSLKIEGKLAIVANSTYLWHVLHLPMEFFSQRMASDVAGRQATNEGVASTLVSQLAPVALNFAMLIFYLTVMLRYSVVLTLIGIGSLVINILVARAISQKRLGLSRVQIRDVVSLDAATVAGVEMIETIKSSGAENGFFQHWAGLQAAVNTQHVKFSELDHYLGSVPGLVSGVSNLIILMTGSVLIMSGEFTVGMLMAFQGFMVSFLSPAQSFISLGQNIQEMRAKMEHIEDIMEYPADVNYKKSEEEETGNLSKLTGTLELKNVTFGYSRLAEPLIKDFSLTLKPGQRVAFVGASGCGKSTLSKIISGLYKPWSGEILFDGNPISEIPREVLTSSLAVVDQDIILFEDTIAANLKMWDSSIEDFEMILGARDASLHEDIMGRDGGYQYKILEGGKDFSGGQRQRMEIARVLAQDPTLIILDEATSALDAKTEYEVIKSIKDRGVACIVVAHRLSTIQNCDKIIVIDKGRIVEQGTHETLYAQGGAYTTLISNE